MTLTTPRLTLVPAIAALLTAELADRSHLATLLGAEVPASWPPELYDEDAVTYFLSRLTADGAADEWGSYYIVLGAAGSPGAVVIGAGGFKGGPDANGCVEIGYSVLTDFQRRGFGSEAVAGWISFAWHDSRIRKVVAHTLPHLTPSIEVLRRNGFRFAGEGADPGAPPGEIVVRYELERPTSA